METRFFKNKEKGILQDELYRPVFSMSKVENFNIHKFYECLDRIISKVENEEVYHSLRYLILTGPNCYFGSIYYILKYNVLDYSCNEEFQYLKQFIDYEIEVYMLVNFIEFITE